MKKLFVLLLALGLLLCLCGCAQAPKATLILTCYDYNIVQELTPEESKEVSRIFNSMWMGDLFSVPSCGFGPDVAIRVGGKTYMIAKDSCSGVQKGKLYYYISDRDMDYIHSLFEKYSGQPWERL